MDPHRGWFWWRWLLALQAFDPSERHGQPHHAAAHLQLLAVVAAAQHLSGFAQAQQPHPIASRRTPAAVLLLGGALRRMLLLEAAQPLPHLPRRFAIGFGIAQPANQLAHLLAAFANGAHQLLLGFALARLLLLLLLLPALLQLFMQQFSSHQQSCSFFSGLLLPLALLLEAADHRVHRAGALLIEQLLSTTEHRFAQAQAPSHGQRIAAAGNAPEQAVGGPQAHLIKFNGGVFKAGVVVFECLQLAEVGGGDTQLHLIGEMAQQRCGQGSAFAGVGASAHLIEQHQRRHRCCAQAAQGFQDPGDAAHVAAEGGEVLLQRLLIADVGQHRVAPGQLRDAAAGQKQPCPRHQGGQPQAFEGHGFAAGVGAGDGNHPQGRLDLQAHRHHSSAAFLALLPNQQRVAQLFELPALATQGWFDSSQPGAVARSR